MHQFLEIRDASFDDKIIEAQGALKYYPSHKEEDILKRFSNWLSVIPDEWLSKVSLKSANGFLHLVQRQIKEKAVVPNVEAFQPVFYG